jgi:phosphatidylserine/phosphatidylglycerophosphate/cardiolipin synthase-like enzyme
MIAVTSQAALLDALTRARSVACAAYVLRAGQVSRALAAAAERGAAVSVSLAGDWCGTADGGFLSRENGAAAAVLRAAGARVHVAACGERPVHMKAAIVDGTAYLDDRNWTEGGDAILRTRDPKVVSAVASALDGRPGAPGNLATLKGRALQLEAAAIDRGRGSAVVCESESFSASAVSSALRRRALGGASVRLLVSARDLRDNPREAAALRALQAAGADVRVGGRNEKICVAGDRAWTGSANASGGAPQTLDWGLATRRAPLVAALGARFERDWAASQPLRRTTLPAAR